MASSALKERIGTIGIWSMELRFGDAATAMESARELDDLGYGSIWIPGGIGGPVLDSVSALLGATSNALIGTGILNIWKHEASEVGAWWHGQSAEHQERIMLGLGVSHGPIIGEGYAKPLGAMRAYLDALSAQGVPAPSLCLAALGPKMLELARERTGGVHPYLITPEHTASARQILGPEPLLAPEQGVVLEEDADRARALARQALEHYRYLPNYVNNWLRLGFAQEEIDALSDRLIDKLFAWGSAEAIAERVQAHLAAGADHVCLQVITGAGLDVEAARPAYRALAKLLL